MTSKISLGIREVSTNSVGVLPKKTPFPLNQLLMCRLELQRGSCLMLLNQLLMSQLELQRESCSAHLKLFGTLLYAILEENHGQHFDEIVVHDGQ